MKFSSIIRTQYFSLTLIALLLLVPSGQAKAAFTSVPQLGIDLGALQSRLSDLQRVSSKVPALQGSQGQISQALQNLAGLNAGVTGLERVLGVPIISQVPGVQGPQSINAGIEGFNALLNTPLLGNFEGAGEIRQVLGKTTDYANGLAEIGNLLDIPEIKSLDALVNYVQGGGSSIGGGFTGGSVFSAAGLGSITNSNQAVSKITEGITKIVQKTGGDSVFAKGLAEVGKTLVGDKADQIFNITGKVPTTSSGIDVSAACQVGGGTSGGVGEEIVAGVQGRAEDIIGGAVQQKATSLLGTLADATGLSGLASNFGLGGAISQISGIGKGVPVVEQTGPLLTISQESRGLSEIACQHLAVIRHIQQYLNPEARKAAQEEIARQASDWEKEEVQGRTTAEGLTGQSYFVDRQSYVEENTRAARAKTLALVSNSLSGEFKDDIVRQLTKEAVIENTPGQKLLASLQEAPAPVSNDPGEQWLTAINPKNNVYVKYFTAQNIINQEAARAEQNARETLTAGSGVAPSTYCPDGTERIETPVGLICDREAVLLPGKIIADKSSAFKTTALRQAENADSIEEDKKSIEALKNEQIKTVSAREIAQGRQIGANEIFGVVDIVCRLAPKIGFCDEAAQAQNIFGTINDVAASLPLPAEVAFSVGSEVTSSTGPDTIPLTWQARNASQCVAANDWITFSDRGSSTLNPSVLVAQGTSLGTNGKVDISKPSLFKVLANADGTPQQDQLFTRFVRGNQETIFTPDVSGLRNGSSFQITINNRTIHTKELLASFKAPEVVAYLKAARDSLSPGSAAALEFSKYTFSGEDTLTISRPLPQAVPTGAEYRISCAGALGGGEDSVTVRF